ncbi:MAG TPA: M2 family metallopeptidase [Terriglobales bacterium]|nr:M2 family metallopeptidase [Terriglobales bacterium]
MFRIRAMAHAVVLSLTLLACSFSVAQTNTPKTASPAKKTTAVAGSPNAQQFILGAEKRLSELSVKTSRAQWVQSNFITDDTEILAADANNQMIAATTELALAARKFDAMKLPADASRKFRLLKLSMPMPAPNNAAERNELTRIATSLEADYGKGKFCIDNDQSKCYDLTAAEKLLAANRDPELAKKLWLGWHSISPPMRQRYARFVELSNKGAREMGFADVGAMWRSNYDMPPDAFANEVERIWEQVKPLYLSLHAYVRSQLVQKYGPSAVTPDGMIRADLLGNMWAQDWTNIYDLVAPANASAGFDLTELLKQKNVDELGMVRYGERFFTSLGFAPLPKTFWERSLFVKPQDREVVCHASAWDIDNKEDLRLKMCIQRRGEDFRTVHHELGHNIYQRAYMNQPFFFQGSANDGFHEAVGDTIALSITPEYLNKVGLLENVPPVGPSDTGLLLDKALEKVAFLPFGLLIDQWRWGVFSGKIAPADYNKAWWELRNKYQGVAAPVARTENEFDPGAKYHVPGNTPYTRYFLAAVLQFQFHRALCREAGYQGPLHRCSIYDNKAAGQKLARMLEMGQSRPWQEALFEMTGERQMDGGAMLEYFAPLKQWLDEQNSKNQAKLGWAAK